MNSLHLVCRRGTCINSVLLHFSHVKSLPLPSLPKSLYTVQCSSERWSMDGALPRPKSQAGKGRLPPERSCDTHFKLRLKWPWGLSVFSTRQLSLLSSSHHLTLPPSPFVATPIIAFTVMLCSDYYPRWSLCSAVDRWRATMVFECDNRLVIYSYQ